MIEQGTAEWEGKDSIVPRLPETVGLFQVRIMMERSERQGSGPTRQDAIAAVHTAGLQFRR